MGCSVCTVLGTQLQVCIAQSQWRVSVLVQSTSVRQCLTLATLVSSGSPRARPGLSLASGGRAPSALWPLSWLSTLLELVKPLVLTSGVTPEAAI